MTRQEERGCIAILRGKLRRFGIALFWCHWGYFAGIWFGGLFFGAAMDNSQTMGSSLVMGGIGAIVLAVTIVWHLYRIARGWIALSSRRAVP